MADSVVTQAHSGLQHIQSVFPPFTVAAAYIANKLLPIEIPGVDELIHGYLSGVIPHVALQNFAGQNGVKIPDFNINTTQYTQIGDNGKLTLSLGYRNASISAWDLVLRDRTYLPTIDEAGVMLNRGVIDNALYDHIVGRQTDNNYMLVSAYKTLTIEIPGPSDLVRFGTREVWNPALLQLFEYSKEMPTAMIPWMEKQGFVGSIGIDLPPNSTNVSGEARQGQASWSDAWWWSHWELPSLTEGYEMLRRLYQSTDYGPSPIVTDETRFDSDTLHLLQRAQNLTPYWRSRLEAISYHPLTMGEIEYSFVNNNGAEATVYHTARQNGYSDADAKVILQNLRTKKARDLDADPRKASMDYVCRYYKEGILTDGESTTLLTNNGYDPNEANGFLDKCKLEIKADTVISNTKVLKEGYYRGLYDQAGLIAELARNGLNSTVTEYWVIRWTYERDLKVKQPAARMLLTYYKNGTISQAELQQRLFNLGYDGASISIMIRNQNILMLQAQTAALAKAAKQQQQAALAASKQAAKIAKAKATQQAKNQKVQENIALKRLRNLIKASSDANIKAWYADKTITLSEVYYRLFAKGYGYTDADRWIHDLDKTITTEIGHAASQKAAKQFLSEGNYIAP